MDNLKLELESHGEKVNFKYLITTTHDGIEQIHGESGNIFTDTEIRVIIKNGVVNVRWIR